MIERVILKPVVVVPVKDLHNAKQRLAPRLSETQRQALYCAMLEDVLTALTQVDRVARILLVTRDPQIRQITARFGVDYLHEDENQGHSAAVNLAAQTLIDQGAQSLLQVPGDIPLVTADDINAVIDGHACDGFAAAAPESRETDVSMLSPAVTIAPSHDRRGSNALLCSPPDIIKFQFGDDSFLPHMASARAAGVEPTVIERHGLAMDIDTPSDIDRFMQTPSATQAHQFLAGH